MFAKTKCPFSNFLHHWIPCTRPLHSLVFRKKKSIFHFICLRKSMTKIYHGHTIWKSHSVYCSMTKVNAKHRIWRRILRSFFDHLPPACFSSLLFDHKSIPALISSSSTPVFAVLRQPYIQPLCNPITECQLNFDYIETGMSQDMGQ